MKALAALPLLAIPFGTTAVLAAMTGLIVWAVYDRDAYAENLFRALDRLGAAFLGLGSGRYTVSAECGARDCRFCRWLCRLLTGCCDEG